MPEILLREKYPMFEIGEESYGGLHAFDWSGISKGQKSDALKIGAYCSFGFEVKFLLGGEHNIDWVTTFPFNARWPEAEKFTGHPKTNGPIIVGNDVWIGAEAMILSGVTIGDGAVIGARSVVVSNVPAYSVSAGHPCRHLRWRFSEWQRERLLELKWWDWPREKIERSLPLLLSNNIEGFLRAADVGYLEVEK